MRIWAVNLQSTVTQGHFRNLKKEKLGGLSTPTQLSLPVRLVRENRIPVTDSHQVKRSAFDSGFIDCCLTWLAL